MGVEDPDWRSAQSLDHVTYGGIRIGALANVRGGYGPYSGGDVSYARNQPSISPRQTTAPRRAPSRSKWAEVTREREAQRLQDRGARIERVVLDYELKRDYQKWLHEHDRERPDYDGHPDRDAEEIREWANEHHLPYFDGQVHFPDVRIEYDDRDGHHRVEDIEVVTANYRGARGASAARSGFTCYFLASGHSSRGRGGTRRARGMEDFL